MTFRFFKMFNVPPWSAWILLSCKNLKERSRISHFDKNSGCTKRFEDMLGNVFRSYKCVKAVVPLNMPGCRLVMLLDLRLL